MYTGKLKFFDEVKCYGFIVVDETAQDLFVHYDDFLKAKIDKDLLKKAKHGTEIRFQFQIM